MYKDSNDWSSYCCLWNNE